MSEQTRALVIEDSREDAEYIRLLLEVPELFELRFERRLADGIDALEQASFDVILLDLMLPDSSGIDTFLSIYKKQSHIPVVVLTGTDDTDLAKEAMREGAQDFLVKGQFDSELLVRSIRYAVARQSFMEEIRTYARQLIESEFRFRQIIANNADMMVVTDLSGKILYMNPAAVAVFHSETTQIPAGFLPTEKGEMREIEFELPTGELRILQVKTVTTEWEGRNAYLASIRDITLRRTAEKEVLQASELERQRIGQELHDGLGQKLTALAFMAKAITKHLESERSDTAAKAQELSNALNETIIETTRLSRGLYPVGLEQAGLVNSLADLAKQVSESSGVNCTFSSDFEDLNVGIEPGFHLYRIAQEAINNALRHGEATEINVSISCDESNLKLVIEDNGVGFKRKAGADGMGLRNMAYRARLISSWLQVNSEDGVGTTATVTLKLPLEKDSV